MIVFLIRRLIQAAIVLVAMSFLVFVGVFAIGNPADILVSPEATQIERQAVIERFGLDQPWWVQYARFLWRAARGDMGDSFRHATPAVQLILERLPATLELAILAMVMAVALGIPLGLLAGIRSQSLIGRFIMGFSILGFSVPTFWVGLIM
ncbi:MAG: ABC transporter permease, partial [Candidatus Methylomirabilota bacterium]